MAPSPLRAREFFQPGAFWTGSEVLFWGGVIGGFSGSFQPRPEDLEMDGGAYDPLTDKWRMIPAAPLEHRSSYSAVWTGTELIIWGGRTLERNFDDGAAYNPKLDQWRKVAPSPLSARCCHASVWTGQEMLVVGGEIGSPTGECPCGLPRDGAAYDPAADRWRDMSGVHFDWWIDRNDVWTGEEWIITNSAVQLGVAYRPATDTWRELPFPPVQDRLTHTFWSGSEVLLVECCSMSPPAVFAYDPTTDKWRKVGEMNPTGLFMRDVVVWTGLELLAAFPLDEMGATPSIQSSTKVIEWHGLAYDPIHQASRPLAVAPMKPWGNQPAVVWTGSEMIVWGGDDTKGGRDPAQGAIFDPGY